MDTPNSLNALWISYSVVWALIFIYLVFFSLKLSRLEKQNKALKDKLDI